MASRREWQPNPHYPCACCGAETEIRPSFGGTSAWDTRCTAGCNFLKGIGAGKTSRGDTMQGSGRWVCKTHPK